MKTVLSGVIGLMFAVALVVPAPANAQSSNIAAMLEQVQALMEQVEELQKRLAELRGEIRTEIKAGLREGMSDEDIEEIQELLATDPGIYPEGLTTGYFGPLTRQALMRFQERFGLERSGALDDETRAYLEELLEDRFNGNVPPGLLRAPGIQKKVHDRLRDRCEDSDRRGLGLLCERVKGDDDSDDDANDDSDDANDDEDELEIEVEIEHGSSTVEIEYADGGEEEFTFDTTDEDEIIDMIVDETDLTEDEVRDVIEFDRDDDDNDDEEEDENDDDDDSDDDEDDDDE